VIAEASLSFRTASGRAAHPALIKLQTLR